LFSLLLGLRLFRFSSQRFFSQGDPGMTKFVRFMLVAAFAAIVLAPLTASAQEEGQGRRGRGQRGQGGQGFQRSPLQLPRSVELTDEQKTKMEELKKKYEEKLTAAQEKARPTDEQRTALREAFGKAREEGKSGEELRKAAEGAVTWTEDQKKAREELTALTKEVTEAVNGVLTVELK
jgi:Spy/CpxP family protein refolding chaperone